MELEQQKCITGQSESGLCGTAAFCAQPYKCCAECNKYCNVRCGWANGKDPGAQETQDDGLDGLLNKYRNIVFFDVETTGFNAQSHKIIELAAIGVRRNFEGKVEIWKIGRAHV